MALVGNGVRLSASNPMRQSGAASVGTQTMVRERTPGSVRNIYTGHAVVNGETSKASIPNGYRMPYCWVWAPKSGSMRSYVDGAASIAGAGAMGVAAVGTINGVGAATATGALIVTAAGTIAGTSTATANILAALIASGTIAASCTVTAALTALGWATGAAAGVATLTATRYATGELAGEITPFTELSPQNLAAAVWEAIAGDYDTAGTMGEKLNGAGSAGNPWTEVIETGMTAAQAMRLITSVLGGELAGAGTSTITFRNAVADDTTRVTATVDESGNRTAITTDLD